MADYTPTLRDHIGFHNTLQLVKPESPQAAVQSVWEEIVIEWFPGRHGYKWEFKAATLATNNMPVPDVTVIEVWELKQNIHNTNQWAERRILIIQCKRPSYDTPSYWNDTVEAQFKEDLSQNLNISEKIFGAVAIGKKVRFFKFDGPTSPGYHRYEFSSRNRPGGANDEPYQGKWMAVDNLVRGTYSRPVSSLVGARGVIDRISYSKLSLLQSSLGSPSLAPTY